MQNRLAIRGALAILSMAIAANGDETLYEHLNSLDDALVQPDPEERVAVVYIDGGALQSVMSNDPDLKVILHDQDNIEGGDEEPEIPEGLKEVW